MNGCELGIEPLRSEWPFEFVDGLLVKVTRDVAPGTRRKKPTVENDEGIAVHGLNEDRASIHCKHSRTLLGRPWKVRVDEDALGEDAAERTVREGEVLGLGRDKLNASLGDSSLDRKPASDPKSIWADVAEDDPSARPGQKNGMEA
jgi:hypothetical protein